MSLALWMVCASGAALSAPQHSPALPATPSPSAPPGAATTPTPPAARTQAPTSPPAEATGASAPAPPRQASPDAPLIVPPAAGTDGTAAPISETEFQQLLQKADLDRLDLLCRQLAGEGDGERLRRLRERLLTLHPAPQPLAVVLANADVLLSCRMPEAALTVLERISPARGAEQVQWLTLQWRAANAALDHRQAALALERLASGTPARLELVSLPLQPRPDGTWARRSALELLASHLESEGLGSTAASLLLLSRGADVAAAERLAQAVRLLGDLPPTVREPLFERALEQAAAAGSWGLVGELLAAQAALPATPEAAARTAERRLRLSRRLDDAYGEWRTLQESAGASPAGRQGDLERRLRSPLAPGGHGASLPDPDEPQPASAPDPAATAPPSTAPSSGPLPLSQP
jgi:hypothetical protein